MERSMTKLAGMLAKMRREHLWQYVCGFQRFDNYVESVLGSMSRRTIYNLLAIGELTEGANPIAPETVEKMGHVKALELARLDPEQRTPDIVRSAVEDR